MTSMTQRPHPDSRLLAIICGLLSVLPFVAAQARAGAEPTPVAVAVFNSYINVVQSRLDQQHRTPNAFIVRVAAEPDMDNRLRRGELIVEQIKPSTGADLPGALLHHWRGTAFAPGARASDFEWLMRDFNAYPQHFYPQVMRATVLMQQADCAETRIRASMRVRQKHVITVVMDSDYDITFARLDSQYGYTVSQSTRIVEIDSPGTAGERALTSRQEHGFLWRLNTYWSYEERDGGLYMQIESVSLTRSIPSGLDWALRPFVESVPRESLEFTLRSTCNALGR